MPRHVGKSPYSKFGKVPYRYSETYRNWKDEVVSARSSSTKEAVRLNEQHQREFGWQDQTTDREKRERLTGIIERDDTYERPEQRLFYEATPPVPE